MFKSNLFCFLFSLFHSVFKKMTVHDISRLCTGEFTEKQCSFLLFCVFVHDF